MPKQIYCKNCTSYLNEWCDYKVDSPDPDMARDCAYYKSKTKMRDVCQYDDMIRDISSFTPSDVRPVVLCRDCKYSEPYGLELKCCKHSGATKNKFGEDIHFIEWHSKNFYCADGNRKDG